MLGFGRVDSLVYRLTDDLCRRLTAGKFGADLRTQVSAGAARLRDRGDSVFEDQLIMRPGFQQDGKLVEAPNASGKLGTIDEVNYYSGFFSTHCV